MKIDDLLRYQNKLFMSDEKFVRVELLKRHHDDELIEHYDVVKTTKFFSRKYYWTDMTKYVKRYVYICDICQRIKTSRHHSYDVMQSLFRSTCSWEQITMNFIIELSSSKYREKTYNAILVICDRYIKMILYIFTIKFIDAIELANLFFEKIFFHFEISIDVVFDREFVFISDYWSTMCYHFKIKKRLNIAFHSQIDSQTKRQN